MRDLPTYQRSVGFQPTEAPDISSAVQQQIAVISDFTNTATNVGSAVVKQQADQNKYTLQAQIGQAYQGMYNQYNANPNKIQAAQDFAKAAHSYNIQNTVNTNIFNRGFANNVSQYYANYYGQKLNSDMQKQAITGQKIGFANTDSQMDQSVSDSIKNANWALGDDRYAATYQLFSNRLKANEQAASEGLISPDAYRNFLQTAPRELAINLVLNDAQHAYSTGGLDALTKFRNSIPQSYLSGLSPKDIEKVHLQLTHFINTQLISSDVSKSQVNSLVNTQYNYMIKNGGTRSSDLRDKFAAVNNGNTQEYDDKMDEASTLYNLRQIVFSSGIQKATETLNSLAPSKVLTDKDNLRREQLMMDGMKQITQAHNELLADPAKYSAQNPSVQQIASSAQNEQVEGNDPSSTANSHANILNKNPALSAIQLQLQQGLSLTGKPGKGLVNPMSVSDEQDIVQNAQKLSQQNPMGLIDLFSGLKKQMGSENAYGLLMQNLHAQGMPLSYGVIANLDPADPNTKIVVQALSQPSDQLQKTASAVSGFKTPTIQATVQGMLANPSYGDALSNYVLAQRTTSGYSNLDNEQAIGNAVIKTAEFLAVNNSDQYNNASSAVNAAVKLIAGNFNYIQSGKNGAVSIPKKYDQNTVMRFMNNSENFIPKVNWQLNLKNITPNFSMNISPEAEKELIKSGYWATGPDGNSLIWKDALGRTPMVNGKNPHPLVFSFNYIINNAPKPEDKPLGFQPGYYI